MKLLSQRDKRWASKLLGFNTNPKYTIADFGCLITCQAMFLETTPDLVNDALKKVNGFVSGGFYVYGSLQKAYPQVLLEKVTQTPLPLTTAQVKEIKTAFDVGKYVMLGIDSNPATQAYDQHFVVLSGYSSSGYDIYDPWTGTERPMSDYFGLHAKTFEQSVYQYLIYEVKGSVSCEAKLAEKQAELDEMRESRDKWKNECEKRDEAHNEEIKQKVEHIGQLQKSLAEVNSLLALEKGDKKRKIDEIEILSKRLKLAEDSTECQNLKEALATTNKENERLNDLLIKCQDKEVEAMEFPDWKKALIEARRVAIVTMLGQLSLLATNVDFLQIASLQDGWKLLILPLVAGTVKGVIKYLQEKYGQGDYTKLIYRI